MPVKHNSGVDGLAPNPMVVMSSEMFVQFSPLVEDNTGPLKGGAAPGLWPRPRKQHPKHLHIGQQENDQPHRQGNVCCMVPQRQHHKGPVAMVIGAHMVQGKGVEVVIDLKDVVDKAKGGSQKDDDC